MSEERMGNKMMSTGALGESLAVVPGRPGAAGRHPGAVLRRLRLVLLAMLVGAASGCASYLTAQVTSFHEAGDKRLAGRSFAIVPTQEQADSLEFRAYAALVRDALVREGLPAAAEGQGELRVAMRYSVNSGQAVTYGYPAYGYASYGPAWGWAPYYGPGVMMHYPWPAYPVSYGVVGTSYSQAMLYRRELRVEITDPRAGGNEGKGGRVFEGTVVSEGESASLAPVMPAMVRALFSDFPGPSGVSRRVQVSLDGAPTTAAAARHPYQLRCPYRLRRPYRQHPRDRAGNGYSVRSQLPGNSATGTATGRNLPTLA